MPSLESESHGVPAVAVLGDFFSELLDHADVVKPIRSIEPALDKADFDDLETRLSLALSNVGSGGEANAAESKKSNRFAIIETAVRDTFSDLIAASSIHSPDFARVWNLFDILAILSDEEHCEPALLFWLIEEVLDSQTIAGCRIIFDFLESRRERITVKHFEQKKLAILRTCNELLRRLSRAEDTAFCGRVFIFLYQSFPLGDRSSVNLRGEYHVENVTSFDETARAPEDTDSMEVDPQPDGASTIPEVKDASKAVSFDSKQPQQTQKTLDPDALYPIFWSLQSSFNQPKRLFLPAHFIEFKRGLEATMAAFWSIKPDQGSRPVKQDKQADENKRALKRKRDDAGDDLASTFNPKYLTSRDLFELEISDLSFRRHILVQALIIMDFLLSTSAKAKEKLSNLKTQNKSVMYSDQLLSEEDTKWAFTMKKGITDYLRQGTEGPFFYRMVETVLSRDKNWVRWKMENCPSIEMAPVLSEQFNEAKTAASKMTMNKRLRPTPMGSLSLGFLSAGDEDSVMAKFRAEERFLLPELESFKRKTADDDFEIEMPTNNQTKAAAVEGKASKSWRALRIASKYKLASFDKIENPDKIDKVFEDDAATDPEEEMNGVAVDDENLPENRQAIVIFGTAGIGKSSLVETLLTRKPGVFAKAQTHTSRPAQDGEIEGQEHHFVDVQAFNMMRDGDQFLEFTDGEGESKGTSRKTLDLITTSGKIPVLELDLNRAQQVKGLSYPARFILVKPPGAESLKTRLTSGGMSEDDANKIVQANAEEASLAESADFVHATILNDDLEDAYTELERFIYGANSEVIDAVENGSHSRAAEQANGVDSQDIIAD